MLTRVLGATNFFFSNRKNEIMKCIHLWKKNILSSLLVRPDDLLGLFQPKGFYDPN